jgi:hypothetical protein
MLIRVNGFVTTAIKKGTQKKIASSCMVFHLIGKREDLSKGEL